MRLFILLFSLLTIKVFSQPVNVAITSITFNDSIENEREFTLTYLLKNNTADTLKLFFKQNGFSPTTGSQSAKISYYKIYENDDFLHVGSIFTTRGKIIGRFSIEEDPSIKSEKEYEKLYVEFLSKQYKTAQDSLQKIYAEQGIEGLLLFEGKKHFDKERNTKIEGQILNPNEEIQCSIGFNWDKNRYFNREPHEYYLDENATHYFEITFVALKEEHKDKIDEAIYKKLINDPNFIKGVFVSNKFEINLKPN